MKIRILSEDDVHDLLPMQSCITLMSETLKILASGEGVNPLRSALRFPDGSGLLGLMPAFLGTPKSSGVKVVTVMPGNHSTPYDSHQGFVLLFELQYGRPLALVEASSVTAIRTAAVSAVATDLLARADATRLALLGSGVQATTHLEAMCLVRDISSVSVWSRTARHARDFAEREGERRGMEIKVADTAQAALAAADVICTVTSSREPVLQGEWLPEGAHINAVGSCLPDWRELDSAAVTCARLFVDRRESTVSESGDFLIPKSEGVIGDAHIVAELGELLLGAATGRTSESETTLFKSLGLGIEDLGAAHFVYEQAVQLGRGVEVEIGGPAA